MEDHRLLRVSLKKYGQIDDLMNIKGKIDNIEREMKKKALLKEVEKDLFIIK